MRKFTALSLVAASAVFTALTVSPAAALSPAAIGPTEPRSAIHEVAVRCGPHAHYVSGHRDRMGHYIKGRCVRDKRR